MRYFCPSETRHIKFVVLSPTRDVAADAGYLVLSQKALQDNVPLVRVLGVNRRAWVLILQ